MNCNTGGRRGGAAWRLPPHWRTWSKGRDGAGAPQRATCAALKAARARRGTRERDASERVRWRGEARGKGVRQTGRGCAGEHAGRACAGTGVRGGELCAPAGDWRAGGRCEQRRVMRGVGGGELAQHAR